MSNVLKSSPKGIDTWIQKIQTHLYPTVCAKWGVNDATYNSFGRAYNNATKDGYVPEAYVGKNEYRELFYDDTVSATSFFIVGDTVTTTNRANMADVSIIFMVNLAKIKPGVNRNDEEAHIDIVTQLVGTIYGFMYTGMTVGINQVFKEYSGWKKTIGIKFTDTHPQHCFRINFKLQYNPFLNC
jgi:hypothetical protein